MDKKILLFRIQLDDQLLLDVLRDVFTNGHVQELTTLYTLVPFNPGILAVVEASERVLDHLERLGLLTNSNYLTLADGVGRNVHNLAIDSDVTVEYELTSSSACGGDTQTINDVIETGLEQLQEDFTRNALHARSLVEEVAELTFKDTIGVLSFLFFAKLGTVLRHFAATVGTMLARGIVLLLEVLVFTEDIGIASVQPRLQRGR